MTAQDDKQALERLRIGANFAAILEKHDPKKGDLSSRAEGLCEGIVASASVCEFDPMDKKALRIAIICCFERYGQTELIGRGETAQVWPTNRYAITALTALGCEKPVAQKAT